MPFNTTNIEENNYYGVSCAPDGTIGWGTIFSFVANFAQAVVIAGLVVKVSFKKSSQTVTASKYEEHHSCSLLGGCTKDVKVENTSEAANHVSRDVEVVIGGRRASSAIEAIKTGRAMAVLPRHAVDGHLRERSEDGEEIETHPVGLASSAGTGLAKPSKPTSESSDVQVGRATPHATTVKAKASSPPVIKVAPPTPAASAKKDGSGTAASGAVALEAVIVRDASETTDEQDSAAHPHQAPSLASEHIGDRVPIGDIGAQLEV